MRVGFIGLGRMGLPMSKCLLQAGYYLTVHNRSQSKVQELVGLGAHAATSAAEVTQVSDIVLACLPDVPTVESVFLDDGGIVPSASFGQVLVDHSTVGASTSRKIAAAAEARGVSFLDAPVSGGVERATDATLTIMVGGDTATFDKTLPVFEAFGANIRYGGASGSGSTIKLVNQLLCGIHSLAAAEALLLGTRGGADPRTLLEIIGTSWGTSFMLSRNGPVMVDRDFSNAKSPLRNFVKNLNLVKELAQEIGVSTPIGELTCDFFQRAFDQGMGDMDVASLIMPLEEDSRTPGH